MRPQMPVWEVVQINNTGAIRVTCPRCEFYFIANETDWPGEARYSTRPCPACFKASRLPHGIALVWDTHTTLKITSELAEDWEFWGLIRYSPGDGPNGILYRPAPGVGIERLEGILAELTG